MEFITKSAAETQKIADRLLDTLKVKNGKGIVIALTGNLGSGKTTFVQGLAKALGVKVRVISPTFMLMRRYEISSKATWKHFYHLDMYRLDSKFKEEIGNLGVDELWNESDNIIVIEWAEKIAEFLPQDTIWISFEHIDEEKRKITI